MSERKKYQHPVRRKFSVSAPVYDALTRLQEGIGKELLGRLNAARGYEYVLDVGMGTGRLTQALAKKFPDAFVVGIDLAEGMVKRARHRAFDFQIIQADAQNLPFKPGTFDLLISNVAYQWVYDLGAAFDQAWKCLCPGGDFVAAIFGRESLHELFDSMAAVSQGKLAHSRLPSKTAVAAALRAAGFERVEVNTEHVLCSFEDMWALLVWLKNIGANALPREGFVGKRMLDAANEYYQSNFSLPQDGIKATFEVIWVEARK